MAFSLKSAAAGFDALTNIATLGYNIYQDQRDYRNAVAQQDYQKALQREIFAREDTSLQRRMDDARAAGLNPFSVAGGSGAGTGSVVGIGSAEGQSLNKVGSMLDTLTALERYNQAKLDSKFQEDSFDQRLRALSMQNDILFNQERLSRFNADNSLFDLYRNEDDYYAGYGFHRNWYHEDDKWYMGDRFYDSDSRPDTPFSNKIKFTSDALKYDTLSKEQAYNFYNSDKMIKYAGEFLRFMQLFK